MRLKCHAAKFTTVKFLAAKFNAGKMSCDGISGCKISCGEIYRNENFRGRNVMRKITGCVIFQGKRIVAKISSFKPLQTLIFEKSQKIQELQKVRDCTIFFRISYSSRRNYLLVPISHSLEFENIPKIFFLTFRVRFGRHPPNT